MKEEKNVSLNLYRIARRAHKYQFRLGKTKVTRFEAIYTLTSRIFSKSNSSANFEHAASIFNGCIFIDFTSNPPQRAVQLAFQQY